MILDDPDFDFDPYTYNSQKSASTKDSVSESSDSPLHDISNDDDAYVCSGRFAEEIKLRGSTDNKSCMGNGCGTDDELPFDQSATNNSTLKRAVPREKSLGFDKPEKFTNDYLLKAYFPIASATNSNNDDTNPSLFSSFSNLGDGVSAYNTNSQQISTERIGINTVFQGPSAECDGNSKSPQENTDCFSDQQKLHTSEETQVVESVIKTVPVSSKKSRVSTDTRVQSDDLAFKQADVSGVRNGGTQKSGRESSDSGPVIARRSPGLARRLPEERDSSSSEKELDTTEISKNKGNEAAKSEAKLTNGSQDINKEKKSVIAIEKKLKHSIIENLRGFSPEKNDTNQQAMIDMLEKYRYGDPTDEEAKDVENEYDYVKYVQNTNSSYVGMRLAVNHTAKSDTRQSDNLKDSKFMDEHYPTSSREGSPEKLQKLEQKRRFVNEPLKLNEEALTEIPLNGSDRVASEKNFSLSPEMTECDSAEVESVLSEEGKTTSGMPSVEDGLSSSQGSDIEDMKSHFSSNKAKLPKEILKQRLTHQTQKKIDEADVKEFFHQSDNSGKELVSAGSPNEKLENTSIRKKKDALDLAIQDIKVAIERTKREQIASQESAENHRESNDNDIWIMRDSYAKKLQQDDEFSEVRYDLAKIKKEASQAKDLQRGNGNDETSMSYPFEGNDAAVNSTVTKDFDTDEETDELLHKQYHKADQKVDIPELSTPPVNREAENEKRRSRVREVTLRDPDNDTVLIEGVLFRARYLGSTTLISEGQPSKSMRMMQAQEAVGRIKAPEGENQPSTDVDLFVSTEKIMVLNTNLQEIMMDHSLRTISYIADIGDVIVIMARRGPVSPVEGGPRKRQSKICCHVFETEEAQLIAQSIGQAFQVAYMEFLKANGIEDPSMMKEMDYQEVLNQQEIFGEELFLFSNKETQKEVIVPKMKNEPLGVVIVESGWGSMVPTVVLANMSPTGAAARCGQLNIGDQIMSINGISLVGLPLSSCQNYIKAAKSQTVVKLNVVSCAPVVEVLVKRPDVKYQLGFSVQNGVICSLLRGGIAERGGVRVGHRIIEINGSSVVAVAHEKIVNMLATAVGEIHMKTMPTSIFRLLTGQETPHYI